VEDLSKHKMDSEPMVISSESTQLINRAKNSGNRVFATGIDVLRAVETSVTTQRELTTFEGWTNKFIFPPYDFCIPSALITNFHLPQSTMLMFAAAFGGYEKVMEAYKTAVKEKYRFGAYGDAMLLI
jgi:S-adenosylmethionine:tRNA ribosyltransferase-isomerase